MTYRTPCILILCTTLALCSLAQEASQPRSSPLAISSAHYKDAYLKIVYSQPQKHGRDIFGKLVPYGEVWRTGANEATEITITRDISVNGNILKAGSYSLFTIPDKDHWTILFNSDLGQWGSYNYNSKSDILRFDVPVEHLDTLVYESFTIAVDQKNDKADIALLWEKTKVSFQVQFSEPKNP
jgi:hypothetical protein